MFVHYYGLELTKDSCRDHINAFHLPGSEDEGEMAALEMVDVALTSCLP